jgi:hypothetical protein
MSLSDHMARVSDNNKKTYKSRGEHSLNTHDITLTRAEESMSNLNEVQDNETRIMSNTIEQTY